MSQTIELKRTIKRFTGDGVCCLVIVAICLAVGLPRYRINIDFGDEGFLAYGAVRVMEGEIPNRDFVSLQPPLSFYITAAVFKVFGTSLVSMRALGLCIYILIAVLVYRISRYFVGRAMSLAAAVPATLLGLPYYNFAALAIWQGVIAALTASLFILRAAASGRRSWAFLAGVTTAVTILLRHDQGFYLLVAILVYISALKLARKDAVNKRYPGRMLGFWGAGIAVLLVPLGVYWLACGAAGDMFEQLVVFPLTRYAKTSSLPMPAFDFDRSMRENLLAGLFYLPPTVAGLTVVWLVARLVRRRFYIKDARLAFILALSILFYCQVLARSDTYHLLTALAPSFILCVWGLWALSNAAGGAVKKMYGPERGGGMEPTWAKRVIFVLAGAIVTWFLLYMKPVFLSFPELPRKAVGLERGGVRIEPQRALSIENVMKMIQAYAGPEHSILCLPYQPMIYFLSGRRNPTRWNYLWPGDQSPEDHQELIREARNDPPAVVVLTASSEMQRYAPAIIEYVEAEFKVAHDLGGTKIYLPSGQK